LFQQFSSKRINLTFIHTKPWPKDHMIHSTETLIASNIQTG